MEKEELKKMFAEELQAFKNEMLPKFIDKDGMTKAFDDFKTEMKSQYSEGITEKKLDEALEKFSAEIQKDFDKLRQSNEKTKEKTLREVLVEKMSEIDEVVKTGKKFYVPTTVKNVTSANFTDDTMAYRESGVGQIQRGLEYIRNLFSVVPLGSNTHDTVAWYEQLAVTNNAKNVAEVRTAGTQSNLTWVQKTLSSARMFDYIKLGVDRIKDVDFVMGEIQALIRKNMKLKENDQLINGTGLGNEVAGILTYATEFDTTGISIQDANLIDLLGKIKTQIKVDMLGGATPNYATINPLEVDAIRYKKDTLNRYLFESWALGTVNPSVGGMSIVENALVTENTLIAGDFSLATLYVWDDLVIEMGRTEDDMLKGLVTITAYIRENLRVKDVDKKAIVKVSDVAQAIEDITTVVQSV